MNALLRALRAETLKLRGSLAAWMCLVAPATVVALYVLQLSFSRVPAHFSGGPEKSWFMLSQSVMGLWLFLMLPLFITLQAALLAGLDHAERGWKHLLALPVPRSVHYLAKLALLAAMVLAAFLALLALLPLAGWVLMQTQPKLGLAGWPDGVWLLRTAGAGFLASLMMVALHTWLAIRWRSFTVAVAVGMSATVAGFLIGQSERFGHWWPWSMPLQVLAGEGVWTGFVMVAGVTGGLVVAALGLADFLRREWG